MWSNRFELTRTCPVGVSSGWFDHTEPPRTTLLLGESGLHRYKNIHKQETTCCNAISTYTGVGDEQELVMNRSW